MNRFRLYLHLIVFVFRGIEDVHDEVIIDTRDFVRRELMTAIEGHYARHRKLRRRKT
ncbi:hypothetical protein ACFQXB_14435 [Plastorhodobacter daqingensis]|uniref:Uncharacterized protein n=1 Tax=Plastorhodobacter daqingensis TaxID=1387281 RepID=A0ABW2UL09_9RHOB